jgi:predicted AlkP superfamily phosphohydrolase/phosphomutase
MAKGIAEKVLLVGWDSADWQVITPLLEQGHMPALNHLINNGVMGNLATMEPIISPMLWNSIATGKRPDKHGILGFIEPDPDNRYVRPFTSTSRKCEALWNIFTRQSMNSHVVGWFAGHPAEPIKGTCVSELFQKAVGATDQPWPIKPGTIHPPELAEILAPLRVHPMELESAMILPFVPDAAKVDQTKDKHLSTLARMLAETISVHAAATYLLEHQPWDFAAVYYDAVDHLSHAFMPFHPPKLPEVSDSDYELYKHVVSNTYIFHDLMLGRLMQLAGPEAHIMLISDHGFYSDHLRPRGIPDEPSGPTVCHRPFGIFCMAGPGIKKDQRIYGAGILDIAPTHHSHAVWLAGRPGYGRQNAGTGLCAAAGNPMY